MRTSHLEDENKRRRCEQCGKGFVDETKLRSHKMNVHLKLRPYKCRFGCDLSYNDKSNRTGNEKRKHWDLYFANLEQPTTGQCLYDIYSQ